MKKYYIVLAVLIAVLIIIAVTQITLFEDGSWGLGTYPYPFGGCLPWGTCNL